ncbi:MAG: hypothetical protein HS116_21740 [Planctomycetes bacterium]|nr:hypothetical protein [Planctomycetota bacterium]
MLSFELPRPSGAEWDQRVLSVQLTPAGAPFELEVVLQGSLAAMLREQGEKHPVLHVSHLTPTGRRGRLRAQVSFERLELTDEPDHAESLTLRVEMDARNLDEILRWQESARMTITRSLRA